MAKVLDLDKKEMKTCDGCGDLKEVKRCEVFLCEECKDSLDYVGIR